MKQIRLVKSRKAIGRESGQAMLFVVLGLGLFLLGAIAFAVDMSFMWFHRQSAQTAADAACTAGAMDLLADQVKNISVGPYPGNLTPSGTLDCQATTPNATSRGTSNPAPCVYASLNGYSSNLDQATAVAGSLGNNVFITFNGAAPPGVTATKVMEVDVTENIPTFFAGLLQGRSTQTVRAIAKCGIQQDAAPIPLLVLDPLNPSASPKRSAFDIGGNPLVNIYGGPAQSIQVNSNDPNAANIPGSALVNLSLGGPASPPTGSSFGLVGGPIAPNSCSGTAPSYKSGFCGGTTGSWQSGDSVFPDPLANVQAPTLAGAPVAAAGTFTTYSATTPPNPSAYTDGVSGCSTNGASCDEYFAGYYPNGICVGSSCGGGKNPPTSGAQTGAVFREGLYVIGGAGLQFQSNSCVRMSTQPDTSGNFGGWGGAMFYFVSNATLTVASNAGSKCSALFTVDSGGPTGSGVYCDANAASHNPPNLPAGTQLTGNVLLAPCFKHGTTVNPYGDPNLAQGKPVPSNPGTQRGILFFQDRSAQSASATYGGGGSYAMAGTFYFHSCSSTSTAGTTANTCTQPTGTSSSGQFYNDILDFNGGAGTTSYILGEIIVDNLSMSGNSTIYMDLNPTSTNNIYKAALYQ